MKKVDEWLGAFARCGLFMHPGHYESGWEVKGTKMRKDRWLGSLLLRDVGYSYTPSYSESVWEKSLC